MTDDQGGRTVGALKEQFESFWIRENPGYGTLVHGIEDGRSEKNAGKRSLKRTPAFRIPMKLVDSSRQTLPVTEGVKQFSDSASGTKNSGSGDKIPGTNCRSYKTEKSNTEHHASIFCQKNHKNNQPVAQQKTLQTQSLTKKSGSNNAGGCKPKVPEKPFGLSLKPPLPVGPPPQKPPRTFVYNKQTDTDLQKIHPPVEFKMGFPTNPELDPKTKLKILEGYIKRNSHTHGGTIGGKIAEQYYDSKKSSEKTNLFALAKSLENYHTYERIYETPKFYNENGTEHIYDEPIFLKPNPKQNNNSADNRHELIGDKCCCGAKESIHYMVNIEYRLKYELAG